MSGRPKETPGKFKTYKAYHESGRHEERFKQKEAKEQKIKMLEALIEEHKEFNSSDFDYIRDLYRRANQAREQLKVLSTIDPL